MRKTSFSTVCVLALLVAGCQNSDDDNRGLEYDTLRVNFKGSMTNGTWETGAEVGIFASCTRNDAQDTPMSENANARYTAAAEGESAALAGTTEADAVIADASDHNYRFYAYYPYSGAAADPKAVAAAAPAEQPYTGKANGGLYTASKSVTTVVPTVELQFRNVFAMMELYLPDDLLDEDGNSVVKTLTLKPAVAENFSGALAVSGTYDLTTGTFTENPATRSQQIVVDFGTQGLTLNSAYTKVPLVVAPCTVPEGGFEVAFTDKNDRASSLTILAKAEDAGTVLAAGEVSKQYLSAGSDGIIPVTFPVVFPLGYENNLPVFSAATQPQWLTDGLWICPSQTQAHAKWIKASDPSDQYKQKLEYVASNIGSPGIKGIWTGDCFEFTLPVKRFAAGTSVTLTFPMYTRQGPVFWDIGVPRRRDVEMQPGERHLLRSRLQHGVHLFAGPRRQGHRAHHDLRERSQERRTQIPDQVRQRARPGCGRPDGHRAGDTLYRCEWLRRPVLLLSGGIGRNERNILDELNKSERKKRKFV